MGPVVGPPVPFPSRREEPASLVAGAGRHGWAGRPCHFLFSPPVGAHPRPTLALPVAKVIGAQIRHASSASRFEDTRSVTSRFEDTHRFDASRTLRDTSRTPTFFSHLLFRNPTRSPRGSQARTR